MNFLLPQGIGDSVWALHKIQAVRDRLNPGGKINAFLTCSERNLLQDRALEFIRRFDFISSVDMKVNYSILREESPVRKDGCYNYIEDGMYEFQGDKYCVLIPNAPLEHGIRLEEWLPQYAIDWDIFKRFRISDDERGFAADLCRRVGPYAVFYPGPLGGNTLEGHNRNMLWKPAEWIELGGRIQREFGLAIVVVGAYYDKDYYTEMLLPSLNGSSPTWTDLIGETSIGELYAVTSRAKFLISYQAGVGIVSTYLGTPTGIFWRPWGDSISRNWFLSFREEMASGWVPPRMITSGTHLPLIYGRHGVGYIMDEIRTRGWV